VQQHFSGFLQIYRHPLSILLIRYGDITTCFAYHQT